MQVRVLWSGLAVAGLGWADSAAPGHRGDCSLGSELLLALVKKCGELEGSTEGDQWIEVISILPLWQRSVRAKVANWRWWWGERGGEGGRETSILPLVLTSLGRGGERRRTSESISPKLSRVNGGSTEGGREGAGEEGEGEKWLSPKHLTLLKVLRRGLQFAFLAGWGLLL